MDLSASHFSAFSELGRSETAAMYPTFAAPTPVNLSKNYGGNTLTPGSIPSPLNFPSITPPSGSYSFYGLYSPSTAPRVSPMYDPSYLRRLKSNPMFRDLQSLLRQECSQMQVPASLITTSWNLMELQKNTPSKDLAPPTTNKPTNQNAASEIPAPLSSNHSNLIMPSSNQKAASCGQQVYMCHMKLQDKLLKVRIDPAVSADGLSVKNEYSKQVGNIEMERYHALNSCPDDKVKETINSYFDNQRLKLAENTEEKLDKLIAKAEEIRRSVLFNNMTRFNENTTTKLEESVKPAEPIPTNKEGASLLLTPVDEKVNAVRKLKFNTSHESCNTEEDDYLNCSVNSEDFEIDEIDVETIDKKGQDEQRSSSPNVDKKPLQTEKDLLKQCIEQSGLHSLQSDPVVAIQQRNSPASVSSDKSLDSSANDILPDSSTNDSPISTSSSEESTNQIPSYNDNLTNTNLTFSRGEQNKPVQQAENFDFTQLFSTPNQGNFYPFNPENLNFALSEMQKMCGGPAVSFTPEMRKEMPYTFTPDNTKLSPFGELSNKVNGNYKRPTPASNEHVKQGNSTSSELKTVYPTNTNVNNYNSVDNRNNNINMNNSNTGKATVSSSEGGKKAEELVFENTPVFRTHRMLTAEATNVLSQWYHAHVNYPYPNDNEVEILAKATGITGRQVKKWMANKRVRCFNTLSITGNQHPIKYKYQGRGRKRKAQTEEKENCDSTTEDKKSNYSMLNDAAKNFLNQWYEDHVNNPYPSEEEKQLLAKHCGISVSQVKSWFANKRNRTNNTKRQVPNYFIEKFPEYSHTVHMVGQKREEERLMKRRKMNDYMYIQPPFYI